jgi:hypothetical protein
MHERTNADLLEAHITIDFDGVDRDVLITGFVDFTRDQTQVLSPEWLSPTHHSLAMCALESEARRRASVKARAKELVDEFMLIGRAAGVAS